MSPEDSPLNSLWSHQGRLRKLKSLRRDCTHIQKHESTGSERGWAQGMWEREGRDELETIIQAETEASMVQELGFKRCSRRRLRPICHRSLGKEGCFSEWQWHTSPLAISLWMIFCLPASALEKALGTSVWEKRRKGGSLIDMHQKETRKLGTSLKIYLENPTALLRVGQQASLLTIQTVVMTPSILDWRWQELQGVRCYYCNF